MGFYQNREGWGSGSADGGSSLGSMSYSAGGWGTANSFLGALMSPAAEWEFFHLPRPTPRWKPCPQYPSPRMRGTVVVTVGLSQSADGLGDGLPILGTGNCTGDRLGGRWGTGRKERGQGKVMGFQMKLTWV